jgi:hypothetical protein
MTPHESSRTAASEDKQAGDLDPGQATNDDMLKRREWRADVVDCVGECKWRKGVDGADKVEGRAAGRRSRS